MTTHSKDNNRISVQQELLKGFQMLLIPALHQYFVVGIKYMTHGFFMKVIPLATIVCRGGYVLKFMAVLILLTIFLLNIR